MCFKKFFFCLSNIFKCFYFVDE